MKDLVSVIIPNYNSEKFIAETIESVLAQTYENFELLVIDDCSSDGSAAILEEYAKKDSRIRLFRNERNRGAAYTRNVGLREARGKWIAFLDSDDVWLEEKLEKQVAFMQENGYAFTYTYYSRMDEDSQDLNEVITGPKVIKKRKMYRYNYLGCLTVMYDSEVMGVLQVDERVGNGRNDYALWLKASHKATCYLLPEALSKYRVRSVSLSHGSFKKLIKYQYELFRIGEQMNWFSTVYHVAVNLFFGTMKKVFGKKKVKQSK